METWETTTQSWCAVNVADAKGNTKAKMVGGRVGARVQLTHDEREELNEDVAADPAVDFFRNGFLRPVRGVPEDVMERFREETRPQGGLTAEEMLALFEKNGAPFHHAIKNLNEPALRSLREIAADADASTSQVAAIDEYLAKYVISGPDGKGARLTAADQQIRQQPAGVSGVA